MAFESGVATGHIDYWNKLIAFLTTDMALVADDADWPIVWTHPSGAQSGVVLRGKGSSGGENIYVGLSLTIGTSTDDHRINLYAMGGVIASAVNMSEHINVSPEMRVWLDSASMKYWFVANARRFVILANMSTVYQAGYAGYILPYATPVNYPYPVFVGGTSNAQTAVTNWRSLNLFHAHFMFSEWNGGGGGDLLRSNAYLLDPLGAWRDCAMSLSADIAIGPRIYNVLDSDSVYRWGLSRTSVVSSRIGSENIRTRQVENYGGGMTIEPICLFQEVGSNQNFGILDGISLCPGQGNAAENVIQIGGVDHLVVQNVWRTDVAEYWALALE